MMYYRMREKILFRQYPGHGYITDNSEYGYRMLNDRRRILGERFVTASGAVMLNALRKSARSIEEIVADLMQVFHGVDFDTLKQDTVEFYNIFVDEGFLCSGESVEACENQDWPEFSDTDTLFSSSGIVTSECVGGGEINQNEFLRSIHIDVADACNERCVHCYIPNECKKNFIDSALFYRIIDEGRKMNIIHVTLSGGEPILHPDIIRETLI